MTTTRRAERQAIAMKKVLLVALVVLAAGLGLRILYAQGRLGCLPGYTPNNYFDGAETHFGGCLKAPNDLHNLCSSDDQCEYNCIVDEAVAKDAGCKVNCMDVTCPGVKGKCGLGGDHGIHIPITGMLRRTCEK